MESEIDIQALEQSYYSAQNDEERNVIRQLLAKEGIFPRTPPSLQFFNGFYFEDFECFEKFSQLTLNLDFSAFKEDGSYFKNKEIITFAKDILRILEKHSINAFSFSEKSVIQDFYLTLFNSLLQDNENVQEVNSRIFLFSRSSVPPSLAVATEGIQNFLNDQRQKLESSRIIACPMENVLGDKRNATNQLFEHMACLDRLKEPFKYQIGLLLDFEQVIILWREHSHKDPLIEGEKSAKFFLRWPFHNILNFVTAMAKEQMLKSNVKPSYLKDELKQDNFESLYELFVFCKCISHVMCMKNE